MKGTNMLRLNYETVTEAIQEYLNKRLTEMPVVIGVSVGNCTNWNIVPTVPAVYPGYGTMDITVQENGDFLRGKKT